MHSFDTNGTSFIEPLSKSGNRENKGASFFLHFSSLSDETCDEGNGLEDGLSENADEKENLLPNDQSKIYLTQFKLSPYQISQYHCMKYLVQGTSIFKKNSQFAQNCALGLINSNRGSKSADFSSE